MLVIPAQRVPTRSEASNIRKSTLDGYRGHLKNHFEDIRHYPVNLITIPVVQKWIDDKVKQGTNLKTLGQNVKSAGSRLQEIS